LLGHVRDLRPTDDSESLATLERTLDRGVTLPDTSTTKGAGHNERLLAGGRPRRRGLTGPRAPAREVDQGPCAVPIESKQET